MLDCETYNHLKCQILVLLEVIVSQSTLSYYFVIDIAPSKTANQDIIVVISLFISMRYYKNCVFHLTYITLHHIHNKKQMLYI